METSGRDGVLPPMVVTLFSMTPGLPASGITWGLHLPRARADFGPAALDPQTLLCWAVTTALPLKPLDTAVTAPRAPHSTGKRMENVYSPYFLADPPQPVLQGQLG